VVVEERYQFKRRREMTDHTHAAKAARSHTVYKIKDGSRVPGTTTITGMLDKPALKKWYWEMGQKGIELDKYVDELAAIGTLAHYLIECHCKGVKPDLSDATPNQISLAENSALKWMFWQESVGFKPEANELILVSEKYRFGGTIDIIGTIKDRRVLVDIKTSKGIFSEHRTQVAGGYKILADENGLKIDDVIITRVGRNETESFQQVDIPSDEAKAHQRLFIALRKAYDAKQAASKFDKWGN
jgi:hypothetical protein